VLRDVLFGNRKLNLVCLSVRRGRWSSRGGCGWPSWRRSGCGRRAGWPVPRGAGRMPMRRARCCGLAAGGMVTSCRGPLKVSVRPPTCRWPCRLGSWLPARWAEAAPPGAGLDSRRSGSASWRGRGCGGLPAGPRVLRVL